MARAMDVLAFIVPSMAGEPWTAGYFTAMLDDVDHHDGIFFFAIRHSDDSDLRLGRPKSGSAKAVPWLPPEVFVAGYIAHLEHSSSLVATIAQWALDRMALLSPMMMSNSNILGGGLLLTAGAYQLTPFKAACLRHCRSPIQFPSPPIGNLAPSVPSRWASSMVRFVSGAAGC